MKEIKDVFGRENPKVIWTDVPQEHYDQLMALSENERNIRLARIEKGALADIKKG